jgi:hypothetical protein
MTIETSVCFGKVRPSQAQNQFDHEIIDDGYRAWSVPLFQVTPIFA